MPATFTPITNDVLSGVKLGDERALARLFREHYDALIEEAKANLDDAGHAPRIVETAMLRAWEKRGEFETPQALEKFLHESVHEGAVRDKSRRAALHRFEGHEGVHVRRGNGHAPASADEVWAHITSVLHAPPPDVAKMAANKAELSRHAAAEHMAVVAKHRPAWMTALYLVAAIAVVAGILYGLFRETPAGKVTRFLKMDESSEIISRFAQVGSVTLDDGTKATIGADSKLRIPPAFNTEVRGVRVTGTASFDVTQQGVLPFEVRLGEVAVLATGTKFAVNFDTATTIAMVRVDEGSVDVRFGDAVRPLAAGTALEVDSAGNMREPDKGALDEALAWTNGRLVIVDRTLRQALEQTRRWYGVALIPNDMSLMDRKVSVDAPLDSSTAMIADLEASGNMVFGWEDKTMVLYDSAKPIPKKKK
ncbi:MAG: FecR domain-containing protein [Gemmatimonadota bacterium]